MGVYGECCFLAPAPRGSWGDCSFLNAEVSFTSQTHNCPLGLDSSDLELKKRRELTMKHWTLKGQRGVLEKRSVFTLHLWASARTVEFFDRRKTDSCFHSSRIKVRGSKRFRYRRSSDHKRRFGCVILMTRHEGNAGRLDQHFRHH